MDINRSEFIGDRRLRLANSSPDVKALFHSPVNSYIFDDHNHSESSYLGSGPSGGGIDYWSPSGPLAPIVSCFLSCCENYHSMGHILQGSGVSKHTMEDAFKRGSDSFLEAKLKDQSLKPRSLTNRAQSLDLTHSLSKITESNTGMVPPDSPTTSTAGNDTCGDISPISGTTPSFPSVYGPSSTGVPQAGLTPTAGCIVGSSITASGIPPIVPSVTRLSGPSPTRQRPGRTPDNSSEDVSKMLSNLGL